MIKGGGQPPDSNRFRNPLHDKICVEELIENSMFDAESPHAIDIQVRDLASFQVLDGQRLWNPLLVIVPTDVPIEHGNHKRKCQGYK